MKCKEVKYYLNDYVDGLLPEEMREDIYAHLLFCNKCSEKHDEIKAIIEEAGSMQNEVEPKKDLWKGIYSRIKGEESSYKKFPDIYSFIEKSFPNQTYSLRFKDKKSSRKFVLGIFGAMAFLLIALSAVLLFFHNSSSAFWPVQKLAGAPVIGSKKIEKDGLLKIGEWLETDESSKAILKVGRIGEVEVDNNSRVQLVQTKDTEHRINLDKGKIHATIWAPPKLFFVETPSATAIDLGCIYTLEVLENGASYLSVSSGWVAFEFNGRESLVPAGAACETRTGIGPGTPFFTDAPEDFIIALNKIDFENETDKLSVLLYQARKKDLLSLWHLIPRVEKKHREKIFDKMASLTEVPDGVIKSGIINGDKKMLEKWWEYLGYGSMNLWKVL